jgi:glutathione S-transferase
MAKILRAKLYHYPASRSARVRWALHETLGEGFDLEVVDLYGGDQYQSDFLARNPNHNVPVLELALDDGRALRMLESTAMVEFLADAFPEKGLAPPAGECSAARADYLQMLHFGGTWVDMMLWQVRIHEHVLPAAARDARTVERYRQKFALEIEPQLRERLGRSPYVCGEAFTAADIVIGHDVMWARGYHLCQDPAFRDYLSRLAKRPAFQQAFADARQFRAEPPADSAIVARFTG